MAAIDDMPVRSRPRTWFAGASYPARALAFFVAHPTLWRYVLIPLAVNLVVGVTLYVGVFLLGLRVIDQWSTTLPEWLAALRPMLYVVLFVGLLMVDGFVLVRFGVVLGAPWYGQMSEQVERLRLGQGAASESFSADSMLRSLLRAMLFELKKLLLVIGVGLLLLMLNVVPLAGSVLSGIGWVVLGALIAGLDFLDGPLERRHLRFRAKLGTLHRSMPASGGFSLICLGLTSIPLLNLLAIPLCIAAGTLFFCEQIWPDV